MYYVEVAVADQTYHGAAPLTYSASEKLAVGSIVSVPLRSKEVLAVVVKTTVKPTFPVKPLTLVHELPHLPLPLVDLLFWMTTYYPSPLGMIARHFLPAKIAEQKVAQDVATVSAKLPKLTTEQTEVLKQITGSGTYLLHGETGSGKTRVYIELAKKSLAAGRSAIILTPEIGLTSQLAESFQEVFGPAVIVLHSQLTQVTRQKIWTDLLHQTKPMIVIGARSALFSPIKNVGLIVLDESHDPAYKQDQTPYYHSARVAAKLAQLHACPLILASATPLISDYFLAKQKGRPILRMEQLAQDSSQQTHDIKVIDQKDRASFSKSAYLSDVLLSNIAAALDRKEQALLFLNRRGTARTVVCERCGWQAHCPHCDLAVIYHADLHKIRCHSCSYAARLPSSCPECSNPDILFKGIGTKAVTEHVARFFPEATIMRFDTDNKKAERLEQHYPAIRSGKVDILVGTQTLSKGLDLPKLGLVGIISADTGLYLPDFSAEEKTYQLLSQVIGRVGRGHRSSTAVIQTYSPDSALIQSVLKRGWEAFYQTEIKEREKFLFPPFCHILKLTCRRASRDSTKQASERFADKLRSSGLGIVVEGPTPAFREKVLNKYQWQLVVKSKNRSQLLKVIQLLPSGWTFDIDVMDLL